jgi:hypothetical protein
MSTDALNALGILTVLLLGLSVLVGLLALAISFAERSRVTVRKWLALAWFATLLVPSITADGQDGAAPAGGDERCRAPDRRG